GRAAVWQGQLTECCYQKALHRLRPRGSDVPRFLLYVLRSAAIMGVFRAGSNQNTIDHLTSEKLRAHRFAFPPSEEQSKIAAFLDETGGLSSPVTSLLRTTTDRLREYRSALITAAVTGQLDIRAHEKKMESLV
ncbi:MAG: restriction endonuclease subunit S, partial [Bryobacteraceae bacterium]